MSIVKDLKQSLTKLSQSIECLTDFDYSRSIKSLDNNSIGAHIRHIIEFVQCLTEQYAKGEINYDLRKRNILIETSLQEAKTALKSIIKILPKDDANLTLKFTNYYGVETICTTTYYREVLYNIEHCIHHEALIKVALLELDKLEMVDSNFGIASSTVLNNKKVEV